MKKIFLLILFSFTALALKAQVVSNCSVPPQLAATYSKDIVQLATARLVEIESPDTIFVRIPQVDYDSVAEGLAAIFNAVSIPERDSVFNLYCVHDHNGFPYDYAGYMVQVDTNYAWTNAWRVLNTVTGNAYIDNITSSYDLHVVNFYNWSFGCYAELTTDSAWNTFALADTFELEAGVITAEPNYLIGTAGTIEYNVSGNDRYYNFFFEFNDCFDGCDNYHEWSFVVDSNCTVTYLGFTDWGAFGNEPLPLPVNCYTFTEIEKATIDDWEIFPNPLSDKMVIHLSAFEKSSLKIYDVTGREIRSIPIQAANTEIDFSSEQNGMYIAEVRSHGKVTFKRVIKI